MWKVEIVTDIEGCTCGVQDILQTGTVNEPVKETAKQIAIDLFNADGDTYDPDTMRVVAMRMD